MYEWRADAWMLEELYKRSRQLCTQLDNIEDWDNCAKRNNCGRCDI